MFKPAERKRAYLKIGIFGPAGSGKTASSLLIAYGITKDWGKIGLVDTENGSGELYVGATIGGLTIGQYQVARITAPFEPAKYIAAINAAEKAGLKVLILDSISHAWQGEGGLLDLQGKVTGKTGNSYTAWREVTPLHNRFVEVMLQSKIHLIATLRAKQEYVLDQSEKGKIVPRKVGLAPIQRDGLEYEFTTVFSIGGDHIASAEKDRTSLFDGKYFVPSPETGEAFMSWLESAPEPPKTTGPKEPPKPPVKTEPPAGLPEESPEDLSEDIPADFSEPPENLFTAVVMEKPREAEGWFELTVIITEPAERAEAEKFRPLTLVSPYSYDEGTALSVIGSIEGDKIISELITPVAGKATEIVSLLIDPKTMTFEGRGRLPWAHVSARNDGRKYAIVGDCVSSFKKGDEVEVVVIDEEAKDAGTLLFIESAVLVSRKAS